MILIAQAVGKVGCADIKEPFFIRQIFCHRPGSGTIRASICHSELREEFFLFIKIARD